MKINQSVFFSFNIYLIFLKLYFIVYVIIVVPKFPPLSPSSQPPTPSGHPHTVVHVHGHAPMFFGYSMPYAVNQSILKTGWTNNQLQARSSTYKCVL